MYSLNCFDTQTYHEAITLNGYYNIICRKDYQHSNAMYHAYVKKAQQSKEKLQKQEEELINLQAKAGKDCLG